MQEQSISARLTPKQEKFCHVYIETGNASEAYRQSYDVSPTAKPNTVEKRACELLKSGKVTGRVGELQASHAKKHAITVESITKELEEARLLAMKEGQASAAVTASMNKAKLHGLIVDKHEQSGPNGGPIQSKVTWEVVSADKLN